MIYFTSDHHFYHKNIIKYDNLPYISLEEMHEDRIKRWNNVVSKQDEVWHLGDFTCGDVTVQKINSILDRLNGHIHLIKGNHEYRKVDKCKFASIQDYKYLKYNKQKIVLFHYPIASWRGIHHGSWHLYGHCIDLDSEVLSLTGWKTFDKLTINDEILSYNTNTQLIEKDKVLEIFYYPNYCGEVYYLNSKSVNIRVTKQHNCVRFDCFKQKNVIIEPAFLFFQRNRSKIVRCGIFPKVGLNISNSLIKLWFIIVTDGNIKKSTLLVRIRLYKNNKKIYTKKILSENNIQYSEKLYKDGSSSFNFYLPKDLQNLPIKNLGPEILKLNSDQFSNIVDVYRHSFDGCPFGKEGCIIYSAKEQEIDLLQALAIQSGYGATKYSRIKTKSFSNKEQYQLSVSPSKYHDLIDVKNRTDIQYVDNEPFWCISCTNQNFFIRRKGKVHLTGNSHGSYQNHGKSLDVGINIHNRPISFDEIKLIMDSKETKYVDHHR